MAPYESYPQYLGSHHSISPQRPDNLPTIVSLCPSTWTCIPTSVTPRREDVAAAHQRDLQVQGEFGVEFLSYWVTAGQGGKAFCLANAPDEESLKAVHKAAHGLMPHNIIEIEETSLASLMGATEKNQDDRVIVNGAPDTALRAIMFTDIAGSTALSTAKGDAAALELLHHHNEVVRKALREFGGKRGQTHRRWRVCQLPVGDPGGRRRH